MQLYIHRDLNSEKFIQVLDSWPRVRVANI